MSTQGEMEERLLRVGSDAKDRQSNSIESLYLRAKVWSEVSKMWRIALPSSLFRMTSFGSIIVAQAFIGHSSKLGLAAYALLQSTFIRFLYGLMVCNTACLFNILIRKKIIKIDSLFSFCGVNIYRAVCQVQRRLYAGKHTVQNSTRRWGYIYNVLG